jgi:hypothetical protein
MLASNDEDLVALMVAPVVVLVVSKVVLVVSKVLLEVEALAVVADLMNNND